MIDRDQLYDLYVTKNLGSIAVAKELGCGRSTVINYLDRYNIPKKPKSPPVKYHANHNFFDKWSEDSAYCLGFIAADGHVWKDRSFFTIGIHKKDTEVLEFIVSKVSPETAVRSSKNKVQICVYSERIHSKLKKLGIDHDKTFNLKLPKMPKKYFPHFLRGYFDGDGSVWTNRGVFKANIVSASADILLDIQKTLGFGKIRPMREKYYQIEFNREQIIKLYDIMYSSGHFGLARKKNKFIEAKNKLIKHREWNESELNILRLYHSSVKRKDLADMLPGRTIAAIQTRINQMRKNESI